MRTLHFLLALSALSALFALTVAPVSAQTDAGEQLVSLCMEADGDADYCRCASDLLVQGLLPEEMSMFLAYMLTDDEQDSEFLYSMLPNDKINAIFDQAEAKCRTAPTLPPIQGNEKQRMLDSCLGFGEEPAYCQCAVNHLEQSLSPEEFQIMVLAMETEDEEVEDAYLEMLADQDRVEAVFDEADARCTTAADQMPPADDQNLVTEAKVRLVRTCEAEGENPGDCQCFANEISTRLTAEEINLLLDSLVAEDQGDMPRADWLRSQLDEQRVNAAFDHVEKVCGIDF